MKNISIVMIAKNEGEIIEKSIKSALWANEVIVVVDGATTDKTAEKAKKAGANVYTKDWTGYANQKNFAISKAKNKWILNIDADEIITKELAHEIQDLKEDQTEGYYIPFKNYLGTKWLKYGGLYPDYHVRLFLKSKGIFKSRVQGGQLHEHVTIDKIKYLTGPIEHYTYANIQDFFSRVIKYSTQEGKELKKVQHVPSLTDIIKIPGRFVKVYFIQKGFLDGWYGFINALFLSYYQINKVIQIIK